MVNYAIAASIPSGNVTYTIGEGTNAHTATISPSNTYTISTLDNLISKLANGDEIYVTGLSTGDFATLITALINYQKSLEVSLYVKGCPDEKISFDGSNSKLSTLLFDGGAITSISISGTISKVSMNSLQNISISLKKCKELSITNCSHVNCDTQIFMSATDSLTIKDTTFENLSIDFESNNTDVSDISMVGQNNTLNIRNYGGKTEDLQITNSIQFQSCSIWSCPNIDLSNIKTDEICLIDLPITELPSTWNRSSIYLYSCHNIKSISGTYDALIAVNCRKLKVVDVSNIGLYKFIWNQSLDTIIKDGITYGNSGELIDNLITNPTATYSNLLRFNAFRNFEIYSAPNIINGKLVYNSKNNILVNNDTEVENSIGSSVKSENIAYTGLCTLGQDVTRDYSSGIGTYYIWVDFTNINSSPFTVPVDVCGYNMNTDVKNGLIDIMNKNNSSRPHVIITDMSSSSFNNRYILVLSTLEIEPIPSDIPNIFNINLVMGNL